MMSTMQKLGRCIDRGHHLEMVMVLDFLMCGRVGPESHMVQRPHPLGICVDCGYDTRRVGSNIV